MDEEPHVQEIDADELSDDELAAIANERGYRLTPMIAWHKRTWVRVLIVLAVLYLLFSISFIFMGVGSSNSPGIAT